MYMNNTEEISRKKPISVTVDEKTFLEARALGLNISATMDAALKAELKKIKETQWKEENALAAQAYNSRISQEGLWIKPHWIDPDHPLVNPQQRPQGIRKDSSKDPDNR